MPVFQRLQEASPWRVCLFLDELDKSRGSGGHIATLIVSRRLGEWSLPTRHCGGGKPECGKGVSRAMQTRLVIRYKPDIAGGTWLEDLPWGSERAYCPGCSD